MDADAHSDRCDLRRSVGPIPPGQVLLEPPLRGLRGEGRPVLRRHLHDQRRHARHHDLQTIPQGDGNIELFGNVNNLFDKKPPLIPGTVPGVNLPTNIAVYDFVGRAFTAGVRFKF